MKLACKKCPTLPKDAQSALLPVLSNAIIRYQWLAGLVTMQLLGRISIKVRASFLQRTHFDIEHDVNGPR